MAQAAHQQQLPEQRATDIVVKGLGRVAAGGPIADMQRSLEERLAAAGPIEDSPAQDGGIAHRISRLAGPMLLVAAYLAVALWWF